MVGSHGTKGETRRRLRAQRRVIAGSRDLDADAQALADALPALPSGTVLSYESLPHEPPTTVLNAALQSAGHRVLVPITLPDWRLEWCDLADPGRRPLGIATPGTVAAAIIPALAVDTSGTRLGQGGGCYDRVLPMLPPAAPVLVLLHPGEHTHEALPSDAHDIPVTTVVTAAGAAEASSPLR